MRRPSNDAVAAWTAVSYVLLHRQFDRDYRQWSIVIKIMIMMMILKIFPKHICMFVVYLDCEDVYHDEDQDNDDNPDGITFRLSMQRGIGAHGQQTEKHIYIYIC